MTSKAQDTGKVRAYTLFALVVLASSLGGLSQTGLNSMLVDVCGEFGISEGVGQWLTTAYMLALGVVVPCSSWLMGRFRLKGLVVGSIALFSAGALVAALATGFPVLLAGRLMQAVAAGVLMPLVQTLAMTCFPQGRRATAMGVAGIAMGFAPNIGPTIGGAMVDALGWRSFFWAMLALSAALAVCCQLLVAREDDMLRPVRFDAPSFVLFSVGFVNVLMGCTNASSFPLASLYVWVPVLAGAVCLVVFFRRQRRIENPLVDVHIFSDARYNLGFWALNALFASFMPVTLIVPLYVQNLCGGTAVQAGLVLLPGTVAALVMNPLSGYLMDKIGARKVACVAGACLASGACLMATCDVSTPLWAVCAMQGVRAVGVSGLIPALSAWSLSGLSGRLVGDGSGFGLAARQASASVGTALSVLCIEGGLLAGAFAYHAAFAVSAAFALACFAVIAARVR